MSDTEKMTPQQFAAIRLLLGMTQEEVGRELWDTSPRQIRRYEDGTTNIPPAKAERMRELAKQAAARKARGE